MRILLLGNQNWGKLCVERLIQENENLVGIVTDEPPEKENWYSSMWEIGEKNNIPVFHSKMIRKEVETILSYNPELIISVGFRQILPVEIIAYPKQGCINLHGSLLPKFRGHAPINWAIIKGEKEVGITVHYIDENVDTGTIITQRSVPISDEDTATTVYEGTLPIYPQLLMEAVNLIKSGNVMPKKQHPEEGFYCCRRYPKDSQIKWEKQTAEETHNFVRALSFPYPQSFTYFGDQKIFITKTTLLEKKYFGKPGRVGYKFKNKVIIICKNRGIQIDKIKLEEKGEEIIPTTILSSGDDLTFKDNSHQNNEVQNNNNNNNNNADSRDNENNGNQDNKSNPTKWKIPLFKIHSTQEDIDAVSKVIKRGTRWACGPEIEEFEKKIAEYVGTEYALTFNSGTSALHTLLLAHEIGPGDEVIVPSFTFIATANAVVLAGGTPVFAESESDTFGLDIEDVEKKITAKTKAIITIHYGGFPAKDIKKLRTLADNKNILLIEDAAESIGAKIEEQEVGSFGHSAIFSFCQGKVLAVGEGGALVTNSKEVYEKSKLIRSHGRVEESEDYFSSIGDNDYIQVGYNYRMPTLLGALGISQLNKIQEIIGMRRKGAQHLNESLSQISEIKIPTQLPGHYPVYQMYSIQLENKEIRDNLQKHLEKNGIMSKVYFHPVHLKTIYKQKYGCKEGDLPKTELLSDKVLNIPLYPTITKEELNYLIEKIKEYFKLKQINKNYGSNQNEY